MRPVHCKRLDYQHGLASSRGLVATDIALANLQEIEKNELVSKWIAEGMCTPPAPEQNTSSASSSIFESFVESAQRLEEESISGVLRNEEKSPIIRCNRSYAIRSEVCGNESLKDLTKSPKIGKRRRASKDRKDRFGLWDREILNKSQSSSPSDKSPILGKASRSFSKYKPRVKRKRLQDRLDFDTCSFADSYSRGNQTSSLLGSVDGERDCLYKTEKVVAAIKVKGEIKTEVDSIEFSQDIFNEEIINDEQEWMGCVQVSPKKEEDLICYYKEIGQLLKNEDEKGAGLGNPKLNTLPLSPVIGSKIKAERNSFRSNKNQENSSDSIIQDTEEFLVPKNLARHSPSRYRSEQDDKFFVIDSEFSIKKEKENFVTDTERIDCDTSSENEEHYRALKDERIITVVESDSDKTVSDIIEEPSTQDDAEAPKPETIINSPSSIISSQSGNLISAASPKISEIISIDHISPQRSILNISVETTPPQTPEFSAPAPELLDSAKKKKCRPKKGSLGARLQKLISGQISCVRLWRHQMSRESVFERSSAPCTTLLVIETWMQYGKNLYKSKLIDDPYDLLNSCLDESVQMNGKKENLRRNLVVMTNPDFVGSIKLLPGTVFKIYLPWEIFNRNSGPSDLILHALYFNIVSNPVKKKIESNTSESQVAKHSNEIINTEVIREYDCPCLRNGKIHESCLYKFSNHKIDIIDEIIK